LEARSSISLHRYLVRQRMLETHRREFETQPIVVIAQQS